MTERFEMLREGMQIAEAIRFLQGALESKKTAGDLAQRVNSCLDERAAAFLGNLNYRAELMPGVYAVEGRFARDAKLFALAGEVWAAMRAASSQAAYLSPGLAE